MKESGLELSEGGPAIRKALCGHLSQPGERDAWRIKYLETLLNDRVELHYNGMETEVNYVSSLIDSLCTN